MAHVRGTLRGAAFLMTVAVAIGAALLAINGMALAGLADGAEPTVSPPSPVAESMGGSVAVTPTCDLDIRKSVRWPATPGNFFYYDIQLRDLLGGPTTVVTVTDELPAGLTFDVYWPPPGWPVITSATAITWVAPIPPAGQTRWLSIVAQVDESVQPGSILTNVVSVVAASLDLTPTNNVYVYSHEVITPTRDLIISQHVESGVLAAGRDLTYSVHFANRGNAPARNVLITDTLPEATTFVTSTRWWSPFPPDRITGNQVVWSVGTQVPSVGADESIRVTVRLSDTVAAGSRFTNTVETATTDPETSYANNWALDSEAVLPPGVDLAITKRALWAIPGQPLSYYMNYTNTLGSPAPAVTIVDELPEGITLLSPGWVDYGTVATSSRGFTWTLPELDGGQSGSFNARVLVGSDVPVGTVLTNSISITSTLADMAPGNNTHLYAVTVVSPSRDLTVTTYLSDGLMVPGAMVTYTVEYSTNSNLTVCGVAVTDTIPAGTTFAKASRYGKLWPPDRTAGDALSWDLECLKYTGSLAGVQVAVRIPLTMALGEVLTNTAEIAGSDQEIDYSNNLAWDTRIVHEARYIYLPLVFRSQ
jgi:uncharacterized repeat protein (TIGR01451 family)